MMCYIYAALTAVHFEAALHGFVERKRHSACRDLITAALYGSIASLMVLDPTFL